jgi:hypothetical protein
MSRRPTKHGTALKKKTEAGEKIVQSGSCFWDASGYALPHRDIDVSRGGFFCS